MLSLGREFSDPCSAGWVLPAPAWRGSRSNSHRDCLAATTARPAPSSEDQGIKSEIASLTCPGKGAIIFSIRAFTGGFRQALRGFALGSQGTKFLHHNRRLGDSLEVTGVMGMQVPACQCPSTAPGGKGPPWHRVPRMSKGLPCSLGVACNNHLGKNKNDIHHSRLFRTHRWGS